MKRKLRYITFCTYGVGLVLLVLFILQPVKPNLKFQGFKRAFVADKRVDNRLTERLTLKGEGFYFAGTARDAAYVAKGLMPMRLWWFNGPLLDSVPVPIGGAHLPYRYMRYRVRDNDLVVMDANKPFIFRGSTETWNVNFFNKGLYFIDGVPLAKDRLALLVRLQGKATLGMLAKDSTTGVWSRELIQTQLDGFFCSFGQLHGQPEWNRAVYVYANRNEFFVTDSLLRLQYRANTIDTISRARIKVGSTDAYTTELASPPMPVNLRSHVDGGWLYVQSNIMAANEDTRDFENNAVIDVYDLEDGGKYRYSFYLPHLDGQRLTDFCVVGSVVYALYLDVLVRYRGVI